jgi:hypothetical protein
MPIEYFIDSVFHSLSYLKDIPTKVSQKDSSETGYSISSFVFMNRDRIYTKLDETLFVY